MCVCVCVYMYMYMCIYIYIYTHTHTHIHSYVGIPRELSGKESTCNAGDVGSIPRLENPLKKKMATHSSVFAGKSHG